VLPKGESRVIASLGGPYLPQSSPTWLIPYLTVGAMHGLSENMTLVYDVHALMAALGVAGVDVGAAYRLRAQSSGVPEVTVLGQAYAFAGSGGARLYPHLNINASWRRGEWQLVYVGAEALAQFQGAPAVFATPLAGWQFPERLVSFKSDNETLFGVLARQPGRAPRRTVLYSHGNNDDIPYFWERVEWIWSAGYDVFIYDYRGFGMSSGTSKSDNTLFADAHAALQTVLALPGVTSASLVLYGFSLGGAPSIDLAAGTVVPRAMITEDAFDSGESLVQSGAILGIPGGWLLSGTFDNIGKAPRVTAPWLVLHGSADRKVDVSEGRALYAAAGGPKRLMIVDGADHSTVPSTMDTSAYIALIRDFIENPPHNRCEMPSADSSNGR
jgi:alpha-beta hydrolase superfamily lysophospholipase